MSKAAGCLLAALFLFFSANAQDIPDDTLSLSEVTIRAFEKNKSFENAPGVRVIYITNADRNNKTSLVQAFNTVAGVRMEERSPGSYRLNIRGSSLRSPFGVRNVKVYWNDIPITDPGGNTYFNQFAYNNFSHIEIAKGPAASMYGAGTGGLILVNNLDRWAPGVSAEYVTGSYGLHNIFATAKFGTTENQNQVTYSHNENDGYRVQSAMRRDNLSWISRIRVSGRQEITGSLLFSDMYYQTPGALNAAEFAANPKAARPAGGGFPSAVNAKAAIYQKNLTAGFTSRYAFTESFHNVTTLYGAFNQVKNSAIRNYERRNEPQFGGRTLFSWRKPLDAANELKLVAGAEFQQGYFNTQVARNLNAAPDTIQTNDDISYTALSVFVQGDISFADNWEVTAGLSLNRNKVSFSRLSSYPVLQQRRTYDNELAPRISVTRKIGKSFTAVATVSRGFSPPTIAELLPSTGVISTDLEAEEGWNYELTLRQFVLGKRLKLEATGFYFKLNQALVQRRDLSGADFFINAGDVKQKGVELSADYMYTPARNRFIDNVSIMAAYTYNHFRYGEFVKGVDTFSTNKVPSVPANSFSLLADITFKRGIYVNLTWFNASRIYLNDANTAFAKGYEVAGARLGWKTKWGNKTKTSIYAGIDNIFDEVYSLGNDINAAGGRYYNAANPRNYYAGIAIQLNPGRK